MGALFERIICTHDHDDYGYGYKPIDEKEYCSKGNYLHGVKCSICNIAFVSSEDEKKKHKRAMMPSSKKSTRVCIGQVRFICNHAVCHNCFLKKIIGTKSSKRSSRACQ